MRTMINILLTLSLASFLIAQVDTTQTEATIDTTSLEQPSPELTTEAAGRELPADTTGAETLTTELENEPITEEILLTDSPVRIVGLVNDGQVYFWSNDGLNDLGLGAYLNFSYGNPALVAAKANNCFDIVCNLLATDSTDADFVIVTRTDSSDVKVYEISTRTTVIEARADEIALAFAIYLGETPLDQAPLEVAAIEEPSIDPELSISGPDRSSTFKIRNRQFRSMEALFTNPANLSRDFESNTTWNFVPDFRVSIHNSLLTPGWYKEWFTKGDVWDANTKDDYLSTLLDQDLTISAVTEFQTLLGFRIGNFGFNSSMLSHLKATVPGNLLALPMQNISFDDPIDNGGIDFEAVPAVVKTTLSYAHPLETAFGDLRVGGSINIFEAAGYARILSDDLTITMTQDSVEVTATGEAWVTAGESIRLFDDENFVNEDFPNDVETSDALSNLGFGVDVGVVLDLFNRLDQEVEVHLLLKNIGAAYTWSNVSHELWTYELTMPVYLDSTDSQENYERSETMILSSGEEFSISVPMLFSLGAIYQPFPQLLLGASIEKAFTDEPTLGYSPDLEFSLQFNYYPAPWFDISYYLQPRFGDPAHVIGSGFHFGFLDAGMTVTFINGFNSEAKGIGLGLHSSLHF